MDQASEVFQQVAVLAEGSPLAPSAALGGAVTLLSLWHAVSPSTVDEALALIPHHTVFSPVAACPVPFCWNVATAHFFEDNLLKALIIAPCLVALSRQLERLWTPKAIAAHVLFSVGCSGLSFFAAELLHVYRTHHEKDFFIPVRGCVGLLVAVAVGLRHAYPLETLPLLPRAWGLHCQQLPFVITFVSIAFGLLAPHYLPEWPFAPLALFFGWLHIRYLMWFPYAQAHGDHSDDFVFAALFPRPLRPPVACSGALVYGLAVVVAPGFVRLRQLDEEHGNAMVSVYNPTKGADFSAPVGADVLGARAPGPAVAAEGGAAGPSAGPGSKEYNARRAKALALLDENISSLLASGGGRTVP